MGRKERFSDPYHEARLFTSRAIVAALFAVICTSVLAIRLGYLQWYSHEHYATLSTNNRIRVREILPPRGLILDRNGQVLASNRPSYQLELVPEEVDNIDLTLKRLGESIDIGGDDVKKFKRELKRARHFDSVAIKTELSEEEVAKFAVVRHQFPGVDIAARLRRHYNYSELLSHVIGYAGRISEKELDSGSKLNYSNNSYVGKIGVEKYYEDVLYGEAGYQRVEVNVSGRVVRVIEKQSPEPGKDLYLSIDVDLQRTADEALGDESGVVVAISPHNGEVLAMVSKPTFNPNLFVSGISHKDYNAYNANEERPLYNRALLGQYPPGSTVKPFLGLAGLEKGFTTRTERKYCPGFYSLPRSSHRYRDWKKTGHGRINLLHSVEQSCDVFFYELAHRMGIDVLSESLFEYGFGKKTLLDMPSERSGLVPTQTWKKAYTGKPWYPGETLIVGIGQGYMTATPLQLAYATSIIASRGRTATPHLKFGLRDAKEKSMLLSQPSYPEAQAKISAENWRYIIDSMVEVTKGKRGTGRKAFAGAEYSSAGKTGTSQVFTIAQDKKYDASKLKRKLLDHALYVGFAPVENPAIAVAVLVEHGGSGGKIAAPIARKVMDKYLLERAPSVEPHKAFKRALQSVKTRGFDELTEQPPE